MGSLAGPSKPRHAPPGVSSPSRGSQPASLNETAAGRSNGRQANDLIPFMRRLTDLLDSATSNASLLPTKSDLSFHRTLDRKFAKDQDEAGSRLLKLADQLLDAVHGGSSLNKGKARRRLEDDDDVVDGYRRGVMDVVNGLLEDAAINLDDVSGSKKASAIDVSQTRKYHDGSFSRTSVPRATDMVKPQLQFSRLKEGDLDARASDYPDPASVSWRFRPRLDEKPHGLIPETIRKILPDGSVYDPGDSIGATVEQLETTDQEWRYDHPYRYETEHIGYSTAMFIHATPIQPPSLSEQEVTWVDTPDTYERMVQDLLQASEIAVDLEHHDIRSYFGFTCLIQISTRERDWVVDAIKLRDLIYRDKFGGVFVDPNVLKVLHGANQDVLWLQKDFQIYIVNLFDTHQAAVYLDYPQRSLKALVAKFCDFHLSKQYQLADWRTRPLSEEMLHYARADTHFLLYIYDHLRNELLDRSKQSSPSADEPTGAVEPSSPQHAMRTVLARSSEIALNMYEFETSDYSTGLGPRGWASAVKQSMGPKNVRTLAGTVFKELHIWRDRIARTQDDSPHYVMKTVTLRNVAMAAARPEASLDRVVATIPDAYRDDILESIQLARQKWRDQEATIEMQELESAPGNKAKTPVLFPQDATLNPKAPSETPAVVTSSPEDDDLWSSTAQPDLPLFGTTSLEPRNGSALFGMTINHHVHDVDTSESDLFGGQSSTRRNQPASDFLAIKSEIDKELSAPKVPADVIQDTRSQDVEMETNVQSIAPVEIPEVVVEAENHVNEAESELPARELSPDNIDEETGEAIVMVKGSKRRKKRLADNDRKEQKGKKAKKSIDGGIDSTQPRSAVDDFDYSSVPSLLDAPPSSGKAENRRKKKKTKGGQVSGETFGLPAKDPSQPKGGNKSMTFG